MKQLYDSIVRSTGRAEEDMQESSIDFPQPDLCPLVWDKTEDGSYILKPEIEQKIYDLIEKYPLLKLPELVEEIHIIGSIGTNQYEEDADIDIHLIVPDDKIPKGKSLEDWQKDIKKWYKDHIQELNAFVGKHPIEVYYQLNPAQEMLADAMYDVKNKKWVKGPKLVEIDFNPYSKFKDIVDAVSGIVGETDEIIAELKRDVIDYDVVRTAISHSAPEVKEKLKTLLKEKLDEIEKSIDELLKQKKDWVDMRKQASAPTTPEQALSDLELAKKWESGNALFKFLARYQYIKLITELESMIKDEDVDDADINKIKDLLGVMGSKAEYIPTEEEKK